MLVSLKWLKDYIDFDKTAQDLAGRLTMAGLEVDEIKKISHNFSGVVVAKILSVREHPKADKLSLCDVTDGEKTYPVVCGAKNIQAGNVVPLAKVGASLPGGYTIKSTVLRGEKSDGMLCSEAELEIGDDESGILQLPTDLPLGQSLEIALNLGDEVLDVSITPNRADCLSMIGIAREVAALTGKKLNLPLVNLQESDEDISALSSITILDDDLCLRYSARMIKNVKIGHSPAWLKSRLEAAGLRAINNVVDITNFVMLELGQPLHAFDFRFLEEGRIVVRKSTTGEEFVSLDEKSRILPEGTLLICDGKKPVAIAGIMGGLNSEVKEDTETIFLESAYFNPSSIRRSSRRLAMPTDAAFRFERGIDPDGVLLALDRAAQLIADLSGGSVCKNRLDAYPKVIDTIRDIPLRLDRIRQIAGITLSGRDALNILKSIGMAVHQKGDCYYVTPPGYRVDISREIDLIEEVVRLSGYHHVPATMPSLSVTEMAPNPRLTLEERVRQLLTGSGYSEIINYSFTTAQCADFLCLPPDEKRRNFVVIRNPLTEEQSVMRTTLAYGLLETLKKNINNASANLKIFEIGRIFFKRNSGELPKEENILAGLLSGKISEDFWGAKIPADFYDLKGCVENIFYDLKIDQRCQRMENAEPFLHPGQSCGLFVREVCVGYLGQVHPETMKKMDIKASAYLFEINLDLLVNQIMNQPVCYRDISKFPAVTRDVAFLISADMEARQMLDIVLQQKEDLLENVEIFDIYAGKSLEEGTKSLGLRFSYRAQDRTLTDTEINNIHEIIVNNTVRLTSAKIRA